MTKLTFNGYNIFLKFLKVDKSVRVEIDVSLDQYNQVKDIPLLPEGLYKIQISAVEEIK